MSITTQLFPEHVGMDGKGPGTAGGSHVEAVSQGLQPAAGAHHGKHFGVSLTRPSLLHHFFLMVSLIQGVIIANN